MTRIEGGTYFIRAWREHRGLTLADAAELFGRDKTTILWHESGKSSPSTLTIEKFAHIYDCPVDQITPKPESDASPFRCAQIAQTDHPVSASKRRRARSEPRSPVETDYPDAVLAHLMAGKSPMLAWRLYRDMNLKALAEAYGTTTSNVTSMEHNAWLRRSTIDKLCPIFRCRPEQLLRREGMRSAFDAVHDIETDAAMRPAALDIPVEPRPAANEKAQPSVVESRFVPVAIAGGAVDKRPSKQREQERRDARLRRMQAELGRH